MVRSRLPRLLALLSLLSLAAAAQAQAPIRIRYEVGGVNWSTTQAGGNFQIDVLPQVGEFFIGDGQTVFGIPMSQVNWQATGLSTMVGSTSVLPGVLERTLTLSLDDGTTYSGMQKLNFNTFASTVRTAGSFSNPNQVTQRETFLSSSVFSAFVQPLPLGEWDIQIEQNPAALSWTELKTIRFRNDPFLPGADTGGGSNAYLHLATLTRASNRIPEPGTLVLLTLGALGGLALRRRRA
jgi:hypothetical protein